MPDRRLTPKSAGLLLALASAAAFAATTNEETAALKRPLPAVPAPTDEATELPPLATEAPPPPPLDTSYRRPDESEPTPDTKAAP